ncbi:MAG TPA: hypothetical protein VF017_04615 [Thermoanaerobaculia bacterium]|nr:hypothetical protein [Thermoanaerobaculia bacterium]
MSYAAFSQPASGYQPFSRPAGPLHRPQAAPAASTKAEAGQPGTFSELKVTDGVGDYHINHFVRFGKPLLAPSATVLAGLNRHLYDRFADIFSVANPATAKESKYTFEGADTIEFRIGGNVGSLIGKALNALGGLIHPDWVSLKPHGGGQSFYGSTLRRRWKSDIEIALSALGGEAASAVEVNQDHFLAGRRSFCVGYSTTLQRYFFETAALERSSRCEYYLAEKTGLLRETIVDIWTHFIDNAGIAFGHWLDDAASDCTPTKAAAGEQGYQICRGVHFRTGQFAKPAAALAAAWFQPVNQRHPGLTAGLSL